MDCQDDLLRRLKYHRARLRDLREQLLYRPGASVMNEAEVELAKLNSEGDLHGFGPRYYAVAADAWTLALTEGATYGQPTGRRSSRHRRSTVKSQRRPSRLRRQRRRRRSRRKPV